MAKVGVMPRSTVRHKHPGGGFVFSTLFLQADARYSNTQRTKHAYRERESNGGEGTLFR